MAAGAFWHLEKQITQTGDTQPYVDLGNAGVDIIGADFHLLTYDTLARHQNLAKALTRCQGR